MVVQQVYLLGEWWLLQWLPLLRRHSRNINTVGISLPKRSTSVLPWSSVHQRALVFANLLSHLVSHHVSHLVSHLVSHCLVFPHLVLPHLVLPNLVLPHLASQARREGWAESRDSTPLIQCYRFRDANWVTYHESTACNDRTWQTCHETDRITILASITDILALIVIHNRSGKNCATGSHPNPVVTMKQRYPTATDKR